MTFVDYVVVLLGYMSQIQHQAWRKTSVFWYTEGHRGIMRRGCSEPKHKDLSALSLNVLKAARKTSVIILRIVSISR